MSCRKFGYCFVLCLLAMLAWLLVSGQPQAQAPPKGHQLSGRVIEARGWGVLPVAPADLGSAERVTTARTAALVEALRNLAELTKEAEIENQTLVPPEGTGGVKALGSKEKLESRVHALLGGTLRVSGHTIIENERLVKSVTVIEWSTRPRSDTPNRFEVVNSILVSPPVRNLDVYTLLQKVQEAGVSIVRWDDRLPDDGIEVTVRLPVSEVSGLGSPSEPQPPPSCPEVFSGLIVDVRGLGFVPPLVPRITSAGGLEVYGAWVVDPNVQEGMANYARNLEKAKADRRMGDKPLMVKAIRVEKRTNVVVTDEDGVRLHVANRCNRILEQARLVFLMD